MSPVSKTTTVAPHIAYDPPTMAKFRVVAINSSLCGFPHSLHFFVNSLFLSIYHFSDFIYFVSLIH